MALPDYVGLLPGDFTTWTQGESLADQSMTDRSSSLPTGYYLLSAITMQGGATTPERYTLDVSSQSYSSGWCGFHFYQQIYSGGTDVFFELEGATTKLFRMKVVNGSEQIEADYWNGSSWVQVGSTSTFTTGTYHRYDVHWIIADSGGTFEVYQNGSLWASFSGDTLTTSDTTIDTIHFRGPDSAARASSFGGVVADNADTRKLQWDEQTSSSAGFYSEYTGAETSIDNHIGAAALGSAVTFDADGERGDFNWAGAGANITDSYTVEGVWYAALCQAVATPSLYMQAFVRISGADYDGDNSTQIAAATDWQKVAFHTDPTTSPPTAWTNKSAVEGADFGIKAMATPTV